MKRLWLQRAIATIFLYATVGTAANAASPSADVSIRRSDYGVTRTGRAVSQYTLNNAHGVTLKVITYGGIVTALEVPDRTGKVADIVLGFDSLADYEAHNGNIHFGALIGRYANRIAHGRFSLDGNTWQLPLNDGPSTLHGGPTVSTRRCGRSPPRAATVSVRASRCAT